MTDNGLPLRQAVRALMIDPADRVLLVKLDFPATGWVGWVLPGGGIDDGESAADALRRELLEETGLTDPFIGPVVCRRIHRHAQIAPGFAGQQEVVHLVPCHAFELEPALSQQELLAEHVVGTRWFTVDEIHESSDLMVPEGLADLVDRVLEFGGSVEPLVIEVEG